MWHFFCIKKGKVCRHCILVFLIQISFTSTVLFKWKCAPGIFSFLLVCFPVSVFLFVYLNHYPKEWFVCFLWLLICFFYHFIYYSFNQTHFRNLEWNWFVIRRVREHGELKWQLDILKGKAYNQRKEGKKSGILKD